MTLAARHQFTPNHNYAPTKAADMALLTARVKAYDLPKEWNILFAESSIVMTNPKRTRVVKIDSMKVLTVDYIQGINCRSEVTNCKSMDTLWEAATTVLNTILKRHLEIAS